MSGRLSTTCYEPKRIARFGGRIRIPPKMLVMRILFGTIGMLGRAGSHRWLTQNSDLRGFGRGRQSSLEGSCSALAVASERKEECMTP